MPLLVVNLQQQQQQQVSNVDHWLCLAFLPVVPSCFHLSHTFAGRQPATAAAAAASQFGNWVVCSLRLMCMYKAPSCLDLGHAIAGVTRTLTATVPPGRPVHQSCPFAHRLKPPNDTTSALINQHTKSRAVHKVAVSLCSPG